MAEGRPARPSPRRRPPRPPSLEEMFASIAAKSQRPSRQPPSTPGSSGSAPRIFPAGRSMSIRRTSSSSSTSPPSPSYDAPTHGVDDTMCSGAHLDEADEAIRQMSLQVRQRAMCLTRQSYVFH